jgi:hypothetical protein
MTLIKKKDLEKWKPLEGVTIGDEILHMIKGKDTLKCLDGFYIKTSVRGFENMDRVEKAIVFWNQFIAEGNHEHTPEEHKIIDKAFEESRAEKKKTKK